MILRRVENFLRAVFTWAADDICPERLLFCFEHWVEEIWQLILLKELCKVRHRLWQKTA